MTTTSPRIVWGIDATASSVHLVRITENDPKPGAGLRPVTSDAGAVHTVASTHHKIVAAAQAVAGTVLSRGVPSVVVMSKSMWNDMRNDPSAARRLGLWWAIVDRLLAAKVPVAEFPLPSLTPWVRGGSGGKAGKMLDTQATAARELFPELGTPADSFRAGTTLLAAAGAMAVGISTPVAATQERLNLLSGYDSPTAEKRSNLAIQWPATRKPPRTVDAWNRLHEKGLSAAVETDAA